MAQTNVRSARLEARVTRAQKKTFERAAAIRGTSLSDFVVATVQREAEQTISQSNLLVLDSEASRTFAEALLNPAAPNEALRAAATRHRQRVKRQ